MTDRNFLKKIDEFRRRINSIKRDVSLPTGCTWYPYDSLSGIEHLDKFPGLASERLIKMAGSGPVLDIGSGDGDIAFFLESLGYSVDTLDKASSNNNSMTGLYALRERLSSSVAIHAVDLDAYPLLPRSGYGLAVMLGVLYHLRNPFLTLDELARHAKHLYLSTRIASFSPDRRVNFGSLSLAYLVGEDELNHDNTNFWIFSPEGLKRILDRSGWTIREFYTAGAADGGDPVSEGGDVRAFVIAESRLTAWSSSVQLTEGWHPPEEAGWRWTERRFTAELPAAANARELRFQFYIAQQRPPLQLRARINGIDLASMYFSNTGKHEYAASFPRIDSGTARIEFELDNAFHAPGGDVRELGVLVDFSSAPPITIY
jgi:tRNA (mo5U34)-methyltransferase